MIIDRFLFLFCFFGAASDGELTISPLLGTLSGAALTIIVIIMIIVIRLRRNQEQPETGLEQKMIGSSHHHHHHHHNTLSSTKPLLRSSSPRDTSDERDPDVIPAKYGKTNRIPVAGYLLNFSKLSKAYGID